MSAFDRRWRRLTQAARRAPERALPREAAPAVWLRPSPPPEVSLSWRLRAVAAAWVLGSLLALPSLGDVFADPRELAPTVPVLPDVPTLRPPRFPSPPRLPPPPSLPGVGAVVDTFLSEEAAP